MKAKEEIPTLEEPQELAEIANERLPTFNEKLSRVAAHCAYVRKDGKNIFHNYSYATASDVYAKVNEGLIENRLVSYPKFRVMESKELLSAKGTREHMVMVECDLYVADLDSDQHCRCVALGSGQDHGDKAVMKAQTGALKYAWMMLLNISTGDDPEDDEKVDSRMTGEPTTKKKTKEEYAATVKANKEATYSPEAIRLSDQINELLGNENGPNIGVQVKPLWPDETEEICDCGAPLVWKKTKKNGVETVSGHCKLADLAYWYERKSADKKTFTDEERDAYVTINQLHVDGAFDLGSHAKWKKKRGA